MQMIESDTSCTARIKYWVHGMTCHSNQKSLALMYITLLSRSQGALLKRWRLRLQCLKIQLFKTKIKIKRRVYLSPATMQFHHLSTTDASLKLGRTPRSKIMWQDALETMIHLTLLISQIVTSNCSTCQNSKSWDAHASSIRRSLIGNYLELTRIMQRNSESPTWKSLIKWTQAQSKRLWSGLESSKLMMESQPTDLHMMTKSWVLRRRLRSSIKTTRATRA